MNTRNFNEHTGDTSCACQFKWTVDARSANSIIDLEHVAAAAGIADNPYTQLFTEGGFYALCLNERPFGSCTQQCDQPAGHDGPHKAQCFTWTNEESI